MMIPHSLSLFLNRDKTIDSLYESNNMYLYYRYLEKNYTMTYESYQSGRVEMKNKHYYLIDYVINDLEEVFHLPRVIAHKIVSSWWDGKEIPFVKMDLRNGY